MSGRTSEPAADDFGQLPDAVRGRVIALADEALATMAEADVPGSLRAVRRFTPAKRARLGAASLGAALEQEPAFRAAVTARARETHPAVVAAVETGSAAPAVSAADLAAVAYLIQAPGWAERVSALAEPEPVSPDRAEHDHRDRLREQLKTERAARRAESERLRGELVDLRKESAELRRRLGRAEAAATRSTKAVQAAEAALAQATADRVANERELSAEVRRLRARLRDAETSAVAARRGTRSERDVQTARLRVLLETVSGAAAGLRRELELPVGTLRPADIVAQESASEEPAATGGLMPTLRRGRAGDDPALVDDLLAVPGVHLIVDGYNVTKLGYATLTLEDQRGRLVSGLAGIAARNSGAEITCVFDATAATVRPVAPGSPRGLRVLFSAPGELADQLIVRLAAAEPPGRPLVVVTNDREVVTAVRRVGGETLPSAALLGRLERG